MTQQERLKTNYEQYCMLRKYGQMISSEEYYTDGVIVTISDYREQVANQEIHTAGAKVIVCDYELNDDVFRVVLVNGECVSFAALAVKEVKA